MTRKSSSQNMCVCSPLAVGALTMSKVHEHHFIMLKPIEAKQERLRGKNAPQIKNEIPLYG